MPTRQTPSANGGNGIRITSREVYDELLKVRAGVERLTATLEATHHEERIYELEKSVRVLEGVQSEKRISEAESAILNIRIGWAKLVGIGIGVGLPAGLIGSLVARASGVGG